MQEKKFYGWKIDLFNKECVQSYKIWVLSDAQEITHFDILNVVKIYGKHLTSEYLKLKYTSE